MTPDQLVAHRGYSSRHPDNSAESLGAALDAGARWVEFDVQMSRDGVPFLLHDANLRQAAGLNRLAADLEWSAIRAANARPRRDGSRRPGLVTLRDALGLVGAHPAACAFVELKRAAFVAHGVERVVAAVDPILAPWRGRVVVISFQANGLAALRAAGGWPIGWVFATWKGSMRRRAERLAPEWLFCDLAVIPDGDALWPGPWRWALYETSDPGQARSWLGRGAAAVETNAIGELLAACDPPEERPRAGP